MRKTLVLGALATLMAVIGINVLFALQTPPQPASATQAVQFDHSNCQYPERWSNPADGCDNSDPAVPECIKAMYTQEAEQACIAAFVEKHAEPAVVEPVTTTPATETPTTSTCGGK